MKYGEDFQDDDLIVALSSLRDFCTGAAQFDTAMSFVDLYTGLRKTIEIYSLEKPSRFFAEKLLELPDFTAFETESFSSSGKNRYRPATTGSFPAFLIAAMKVLGIVKTEEDVTKNKLQHLSSICDSLIYVLHNPGFEELYYSAGNSSKNNNEN